jgi:hypothetical protein
MFILVTDKKAIRLVADLVQQKINAIKQTFIQAVMLFCSNSSQGERFDL